MDKRTLQAILLVGALLGSALIGFAAVTTIDTGYDNPAPISDGVPFGAPNGFYVTVEGDTNAGTERFTNGTDTIVIQSDAGNVTSSAGGVADITYHTSNMTGTWTNGTDISASLNPVTIDPEDKEEAIVGGDIERFSYKSASAIAADDGTVDFVYGGASGTSRVTVSGVPASTQLGAVDANSGELLDVATSDSSGTVTFDSLDNSDHNVVIQTGSAPTVSNAQPTGDLSNAPDELSVDIDDADFSGGDTVTVEFTLDGSVVGTQTTTTNGTVSQSITNPDGGEHSWSVDVSDEYGNTVNESYSFRVPTELTFRDELPPHGQIDEEVTATCYEDVEDDPVIIQRSTTTGTIDLAGFPTGSQFSCQASASQYHNRTIILNSLYDQDQIFLINKSEATTVENRFVVNDRTGKFPPENTEIIIQESINQSIYSTGGFAWLSASGDDLGADQAFVDDLQEEERYRIIVRNENGDQRNPGSYTAETTGTIELNIGQINASAVEPTGVGYEVQYQNTTAGKQIKVEYNDTSNATDTLYLNIYERNNESNKLIANESFSGPFGTFAHTEPVPAEYNETTWVVEITGDRGTGDDGEARNNVQFQEYAGPGFSLLNSLPDWLVTVIFVGWMWTVAGLFSQVNGHVGGLVVAGLGAMFFFIGLVPSYLGGGVMALALLTAGILFVRGARGGI